MSSHAPDPSERSTRTAAAIAGHILSVVDKLRFVSAHTMELLQQVRGRGELPARTDLARLSRHLQGMLREADSSLHGIGIATAVGYLSDCEFWLEWWRRSSRGDVEFVVHSLNPEQDVFYDYTEHAWFRRPIAERSPVVTGPYVDAGGTNAYTVTVGLPIEIAGETVGIVGADMLASELESHLLEAGPGPRLLLANSDLRVIASTTSLHLPGTLVSPSQASSWRAQAVEHNAPLSEAWRLFTLPD